ncbi:hypothetical protein AOLI_G00138980 [Acnodon oligacanthus]
MAVSRPSPVATSTPLDGAVLPCLTPGLPVFTLAPEQGWERQRGRGKRLSSIPPLPRTVSQVSPPVTGAWDLDISKRCPVALSKHGDVGTVVIHAGVNDISSHQSEVLKEHVCLLLDTVKKRTKARAAILGPLPT